MALVEVAVIEVKVDTSAFVRWLRRANEQVRIAAKQTLGQGVALGVAHAKATTKFKDRTTALRKSIGREPRGEWGWRLVAGAPHARFVESGTKPHVIEARRARALRFVWHGELRFARRVNHPGTKPTHFMRDAAAEVERFLDARMGQHITNALR